MDISRGGYKMKVRDSIKRLDYLSLDELVIIQGDLKNLEKPEYEQLRSSVLDFGIVSPFHIWEDNGQLDVLDGTQRTRALKTMRDVEGVELPDKFPCVIIDAPNKEIARQILLVLTSQYGRMTEEGLSAYMIDSGLNLDFLKKYTRFPEVKYDAILDTLLDEPNDEKEFDGKFRLELEFDSETEQEQAFNQFKEDGYKVKVLNL
jgi:hypothetical protein